MNTTEEPAEALFLPKQANDLTKDTPSQVTERLSVK